MKFPAAAGHGHLAAMSMKLANSQHNRNLQQYRMVYLFVCRLCSAALRNVHQSEERVKMRVGRPSKIQKISFNLSRSNSKKIAGIAWCTFCAETMFRMALQRTSIERVCQGAGGSPAENPKKSFKDPFKVKNMTVVNFGCVGC